MVKAITPREIFEWFKSLTEKYLPMPSYTKLVSPEKQKKEIALLKETIHYERFFFILSLHNWKIHDIHGVEEWLGYTRQEFDLMRFLQIIHPLHAAAHLNSATILIEGTMQGNWKIDFMKHRYVNSIALRHKNGKYLLCKRLASVFQYDEKYRLLEYINEFTIIGEFKEEPYSIRIQKDDGTDLNWQLEMKERMQLLFFNKNLLSFQELRILRKFAYDPAISTTEIITAFSIKMSTFITYRKRILEKSERLFSRRFKSVQQVATFLKEQWLL